MRHEFLELPPHDVDVPNPGVEAETELLEITATEPIQEDDIAETVAAVGKTVPLNEVVEGDTDEEGGSLLAAEATVESVEPPTAQKVISDPAEPTSPPNETDLPAEVTQPQEPAALDEPAAVEASSSAVEAADEVEELEAVAIVDAALPVGARPRIASLEQEEAPGEFADTSDPPDETTSGDEVEVANLPLPDGEPVEAEPELATGGGGVGEPPVDNPPLASGPGKGEGEETDGEEPVEEPEEPPRAQLEVRERRAVSETGELRRLDNLADSIRQLGETVAEEAVVVGSGALREAIGGDWRQPGDLDIVVGDEAYAHLRGQPGWEERRLGEGKTFIANGDYEVGTRWTNVNQDYTNLMQRSWQTEDGVNIASMHDVTSWKDEIGREKDKEDIATVRRLLQDPERLPLDPRVARHEIEAIRKLVPESHRDDPEVNTAIELAANGMLIVHTVYGSPNTRTALPIVGNLEREEYNVRAYYHNGHDMLMDLRALAAHMRNVNEQELRDGKQEHEVTFTPVVFASALAAQSYADSKTGDGRESDQPPELPDGYDEMQSANLARAHALAKGLRRAEANRIHGGIKGQTFREGGGGEQEGKYSEDPFVQAVVGVDLHAALSKYYGIVGTWCLVPEDLMSERYGPGERVLGRLMNEYGVTYRRPEGVYDFIDEHRNERPSDLPHGPTVGEASIRRMESSAEFTAPVTGYKFPPWWTLEDLRIRQELAIETQRQADELRAGKSFRQGLGEILQWSNVKMMEELERMGGIIL